MIFAPMVVQKNDVYQVRVLGAVVLSLSLSVENCSPALDKNLAPMGPEFLSSTGAGVWRNAPGALPDSSSVLDKLPSAIHSALVIGVLVETNFEASKALILMAFGSLKNGLD